VSNISGGAGKGFVTVLRGEIGFTVKRLRAIPNECLIEGFDLRKEKS
jgi:hypothetical protein